MTVALDRDGLKIWGTADELSAFVLVIEQAEATGHGAAKLLALQAPVDVHVFCEAPREPAAD